MSTIEKALGLLEHFSSQSPEIGLSDFKRLTAFDKGTTHRYLTALKECGFLEQNPTTKAYRLGPAIIRLAAVRESTVPLRSTVAIHVDRIATEIRELVHASVPQSSGMSMLYALDGGISGTRVALDEAEVLPFHATSSGIAQLAFGSVAMREKVLAKRIKAFTERTPASREDVEALIEKARARGAAIADGSYEADVCSVAVPFFDNSACAIGTIAVATPSARMTPEMRQNITTILIQNSQHLTQSLGGTVPADLRELWTSDQAFTKARPR